MSVPVNFGSPGCIWGPILGFPKGILQGIMEDPAGILWVLEYPCTTAQMIGFKKNQFPNSPPPNIIAGNFGSHMCIGGSKNPRISGRDPTRNLGRPGRDLPSNGTTLYCSTNDCPVQEPFCELPSPLHSTSLLKTLGIHRCIGVPQNPEISGKYPTKICTITGTLCTAA